MRDLGVLGVGHTAVLNVQCWVSIVEKVTELNEDRWLRGPPRGKGTARAKTLQRECFVLEKAETLRQDVTFRYGRGYR